MTFEEYQKIDAVNWSTLKELKRSPRHYQHRLQEPLAETPAMRLGRAVHCAVFEPDELLFRYALYKESKSRGEGARKAWVDFQEANKGKTILDADDWRTVTAIRDAVRAHPVARRYLAGGVPEHTITWKDAQTGIACKARLDWLSHRGAVVDLKTARDVTPRRFSSASAQLLYHGQLAFYAAAAQQRYGHAETPVLIAVESTPPHDVVVYRLDAEAIEEGQALVRELLVQLAELRQKPPESWPGAAPDEEQLLALPRWALPDNESDAANLGLSFGGDR